MTTSREFCPIPTTFALDPETRMLRDTRSGMVFPMQDFNSVLPVVTLDAGHGINAPGYTAFGTQRGAAREHVLNRQFANSTARALNDLGYNVIVTRDSDRHYNVGDAFAFRDAAARMANVAYLSLHVNGSAATSQNGAELFTDSRLGTDHASHLLRSQLARNLAGRVTQGRGEWRMLNPSFIGDVPAVLVEAGYLTNDSDHANLTNAAWRNAFSQRLARSVDDFHRARTGARNIDAECNEGLQRATRSLLGITIAEETDQSTIGMRLFGLPEYLRRSPSGPRP